MAIYHLHSKIIKRSSGRSATAAAAYRAAEKTQDLKSGLTHDYSRKGGVDYTEILAPDAAPAWMQHRELLWNEVEHIEKRKDAQLAREVEVALPRELSFEQQKTLIRGFVIRNFTRRGMIADIAIHHANSGNPHAHILLTMRDINGDGFGKKNRSWNDKSMLHGWREDWSRCANFVLQKYGESARIDHRTLLAQGLRRAPTKHLGVAPNPELKTLKSKPKKTSKPNPKRRLLSQKRRALQSAAPRQTGKHFGL